MEDGVNRTGEVRDIKATPESIELASETLLIPLTYFNKSNRPMERIWVAITFGCTFVQYCGLDSRWTRQCADPPMDWRFPLPSLWISSVS